MSAFDNSKIVSMFPTCVWQTALKAEAREAIHSRVTDKLADMRRADAGDARAASWQSDRNLQELAAFSELMDCVRVHADGVFDYLKIGHDGFAITGCWANINGKGATHCAHHHPNNFLSGVYYLQVPNGADTINFHEPRPQTGVIRPPVTELTRENTDRVVVRVEAGDLLMFPAWLEHSVDANPSDEERISISFNIMFSTYGETMSKPMW